MMAQPVDPHAYYGYLFQADKKPTKVLDALLRGIANHIIESIGDKSDTHLSPTKLATFYKAVGGNYDSLFIDVPHPSISWIYASIGCQHTLQPTANEFEPPSIPALTTRGFVRWQSIQVLLGPEEHVPFIQNAVRDFGIKNLGTGEIFPADLPKEAFPLDPDTEIEKWHDDCAVKLRERATSKNRDPDDAPQAPELPPRPKVHTGYAHVRLHRPTRAEAEYTEPRSRVSRPVSYHSSRPVRPKLSRSPSRHKRQFLAPEEDAPWDRLSRTRRRSYPENLNSPDSPVGPDISPSSDARRHSHPRPGGSSGPHEEDDDDSPPSPTTPVPNRRFNSVRVEDETEPELSPRFTPPVPSPPDPLRRVPRGREDEIKRYSHPIPLDLSGKLSAPFTLHRDKERDVRPRSISRGEKKLNWKDLSEVTDRWRRRTERDRDALQDEDSPRNRRERERVGGYRDREREWERERSNIGSRRTSHEDLPRRSRDTERGREREGTGRVTLDNRAVREGVRRFANPLRDSDGRKYASHN